MRKRDAENPTAFYSIVKEECLFYDLQGLCSGEDGKYNMAVEAIDLVRCPLSDYNKVISDKEIAAKAVLADEIGIPFFLMLHRTEIKGDVIYLKRFELCKDGMLNCFPENRFTEDEFIAWWKSKQFGKQKKPYREKLKEKMADSYFDLLLERNNSSWSGNIDAFTLKEDESGLNHVAIIIECRYSSYKKTEEYDPNDYFHYGGGDYRTWQSLFNLASSLSVPLLLLTFSRKENQNSVGAAIVEDVNMYSGLKYKSNIKPCNNVFNSPVKLKEWLEKNVEGFESDCVEYSGFDCSEKTINAKSIRENE